MRILSFCDSGKDIRFFILIEINFSIKFLEHYFEFFRKYISRFLKKFLWRFRKFSFRKTKKFESLKISIDFFRFP